MKLILTPVILSSENKHQQLEIKHEHESEYGLLEDLTQNHYYQHCLSLLPKIAEKIQEDLDRFDFSVFKQHYPTLSFPTQVEIKIFFIQEDYFKKSIYHYFLEGQYNDVLGCAINTGGEDLTRSAECYFNDEFQVLVVCPSNEQFKTLIDEDKFISSLNTLTHEIYHQILFIKTSGGLTPDQVDLAFDSGDFNDTVFDCTIGEMVLEEDGFIDEIFFQLSNQEKISIMEEYIEEKSLDITYSIV